MAEKLSEASWIAFAKKRDLDDAALLKALARLDKSDATSHDARLDALDDVVAQCKKFTVALAKRAKELGDKPFKEAKDKAYELLDEAEKQQKTVRAAKDSASDGDEESPALITTKMVPLLRQLRKGEVRMPVLIALSGRQAAVMISPRAISPSRRNMLAEAAGGGTMKYVVGECVFENGALTFIVQSPAGGLAKRMRAALLEQTGLRLKIRVRGEDGEESDGEDEQDAESTQEASSNSVPAAPPLHAPAAPVAAATASPAARAWAQRLPAVQQRLAEALRAQHPQTAKLRKLVEFAADKANVQHDHAAALKALDMLEQLLDAPAPSEPAAEGAAAGPSADPGAVSRIAPAVVYTQTRLVWDAARGKIRGDLARLEQAILSHYKGQGALSEITRSVRKLDGVLALFDDSLSDALDKALNATTPDGKQESHDEARTIIARYQSYLATDPIVQELDGNPFVPVTVKATLTGVLGTLASKIV